MTDRQPEPGTTEIVLSLPQPREVAELAGRALAAYLRDYENVAGLMGATILPVLVFRRTNVPLLPWLLVALAGDQAARHGYRLCRDVHDLADVARGDLVIPGH